METRKLNMLISKPGGNASKGAKMYRISIPSVWATDMGVTPEDRSVLMTYDGKEITIKKEETDKP